MYISSHRHIPVPSQVIPRIFVSTIEQKKSELIPELNQVVTVYREGQ